MKAALQKRFGDHRVLDVPTKEGEVPLLIVDLDLKSPVTLIVTNGLSNYTMEVPEKVAGRENIELYFCLPSYWEWEDTENPSMNWPFEWIQRFAKHLTDKKTWFGAGHTFPCGADGATISSTMKMEFFVLLDPLLLEQELAPIQVEEKKVHFLAIVPLYRKEFEYKQSRGTFKLLDKLNNHGVTEKLDDFRGSVLKTRWGLRRH